MAERRPSPDAERNLTVQQAEQLQSDKEKKLQKLQQLTSVRSNVKANLDDIDDESNKKKFEYARQVDSSVRRLDEVFQTMERITARCERLEEQVREYESKHVALSTRMDEHRRTTFEMVQEVDNKVGKTALQLENNRVREMQELEKIINLRDKKLAQMIQNEVNEEAQARILVGTDCARVSEHLKEAKAALADDLSKVQASVQSFQSKNFDEFSKLNEMVSAERATRERNMMTVHAQNTKRDAEIKATLDVRMEDLKNDQKAGYNQLIILLEKLRSDTSADLRGTTTCFEASEKNQKSRIDGLEADFNTKKNDLVRTIELVSRNQGASIGELSKRLDSEAGARAQEFAKVRDEMAAEHLRREQDETAIINMLESVMISKDNPNQQYQQ